MSKFRYEITRSQAHTLTVALRNQLERYGVKMDGETPRSNGGGNLNDNWYAPNSLIDDTVRQYVRLNRLVLGHKQFNLDPGYTYNGVRK